MPIVRPTLRNAVLRLRVQPSLGCEVILIKAVERAKSAGPRYGLAYGFPLGRFEGLFGVRGICTK